MWNVWCGMRNIYYLLNHAAREYELFYTRTGQLHGLHFNCLSSMNTQNNKEKLYRYFSKTRQKNNWNCKVMQLLGTVFALISL
jgi:hypothetical protein